MRNRCSREDDARVDQHKAGQCDGITKHLTSEHHPNLVQEVWDLRRILERMSRQLYIQCVMMKELVRIASEEVTLYFAQRRPRELAKFEWTIDAKDSRRITSQEKWWRETLAPLLESASRREPFVFIKDAGFNYKFFDRSFAMKKDMVEGHDIKKMITERMAFVDSRSETLIQAVDILTSFLRRLLAREITGDDVSQALGRLQIYSRRKSKHPQSLRVLTLRPASWGRSDLGNVLRVMTTAARIMLKSERTRRRPAPKARSHLRPSR